MSLGTNYKRNSDGGEKFIAANIKRAQEYANLFVRVFHMDHDLALDLGAGVVLGRMTVKDIYRKYGTEN